jgi:hypothetical protein
VAANFQTTLAFKAWRLDGPAFLAPRAAFDTWQTLSLAIKLKLLERWDRTRLSFHERVNEPLGALLDNLEIRIPGVRASVSAQRATSAGYGNWDLVVNGGAQCRTIQMEPLDPRRALEDPALEISLISRRLAIELHTLWEGARSRPYRPVLCGWPDKIADVRDACRKYEVQFNSLPHQVTMSLYSWNMLGEPLAIDWIDSRGVAQSTPVVLVPGADEERRIEVVSRAYLAAMDAGHELLSATDYTAVRRPARPRSRAGDSHSRRADRGRPPLASSATMQIFSASPASPCGVLQSQTHGCFHRHSEEGECTNRSQRFHGNVPRLD